MRALACGLRCADSKVCNSIMRHRSLSVGAQSQRYLGGSSPAPDPESLWRLLTCDSCAHIGAARMGCVSSTHASQSAGTHCHAQHALGLAACKMSVLCKDVC